MRILVVINRLEDHGGAEVSTIALLDALQTTFADFQVVTLYGSADFESRSRLEARGVQFLAAPQTLVGRIRYVSGVAAAFCPDVLHSTLFDSDLVARAVGPVRRIAVLSSLVNTEYSDQAVAASRSARKLRAARWINASTGRLGVSHFHAITNAVAEHAHTTMHIPPRMISVVPRGRDLVALGKRHPARRRAVRQRLGIAERAPVILNVGRQERQKGQRLLLTAMERVVGSHPDAVLLIAGRVGHETGALLEQYKMSGLDRHVRFLGQRTDVPDLLAACDVLAFPSLWEGLGGTLIEAMALETPIVAFDIPTCREVIGEVADLAPVGNADALADDLVRVLDNPRAYADRALLGRAQAHARYSGAVAAKGMARVYTTARAAGAPPVRTA